MVPGLQHRSRRNQGRQGLCQVATALFELVRGRLSLRIQGGAPATQFLPHPRCHGSDRSHPIHPIGGTRRLSCKGRVVGRQRKRRVQLRRSPAQLLDPWQGGRHGLRRVLLQTREHPGPPIPLVRHEGLQQGERAAVDIHPAQQGGYGLRLETHGKIASHLEFRMHARDEFADDFENGALADSNGRVRLFHAGTPDLPLRHCRADQAVRLSGASRLHRFCRRKSQQQAHEIAHERIA